MKSDSYMVPKAFLWSISKGDHGTAGCGVFSTFWTSEASNTGDMCLLFPPQGAICRSVRKLRSSNHQSGLVDADKAAILGKTKS